MLSILLLVGQISAVICCSAQYDYYGPAANPTTQPSKTKDDDLDRNLDNAWGGHRPPKGLEEKWRNWLKEYKKEREKENEETGEKYKNQRGPGSGWPNSWQGFGGGFGGAEPPPWAYVPINVGLPSFCYEPPKKGSCSEKLTRYAFNAYTQECVEFEYSGCDENQNNFIEKLKCEEHCMKMPVAGCDPETKILMESNENAILQSGYNV